MYTYTRVYDPRQTLQPVNALITTSFQSLCPSLLLIESIIIINVLLVVVLKKKVTKLQICLKTLKQKFNKVLYFNIFFQRKVLGGILYEKNINTNAVNNHYTINRKL